MQNKLEVEIEQIKDFQFMVTFGSNDATLLMDEPEPLGDDAGPSATKVLSAAIGNCLTASLLFCLQKARAVPNGMKTHVSTETIRGKNGRMRIGSSRVEITLDIDDDSKSRLSRCIDLFESFCVVSQSVRDGIDINVAVLDSSGELIYDSVDKHK